MTTRATHIWAVALTGAALFMITLDNLIMELEVQGHKAAAARVQAMLDAFNATAKPSKAVPG